MLSVVGLIPRTSAARLPDVLIYQNSPPTPSVATTPQHDWSSIVVSSLLEIDNRILLCFVAYLASMVLRWLYLRFTGHLHITHLFLDIVSENGLRRLLLAHLPFRVEGYWVDNRGLLPTSPVQVSSGTRLFHTITLQFPPDFIHCRFRFP